MGFAKTDGYYPDGTDKETAEPIKKLEPAVSPETTSELVPKDPEVIPAPEQKLSDTHFVINTFNNMLTLNRILRVFLRTLISRQIVLTSPCLRYMALSCVCLAV